MNNRLLSWLFWLGIFLLLVPGLVHAYLLMPFPGSHDLEAIFPGLLPGKIRLGNEIK
jgi:hypothetical protein